MTEPLFLFNDKKAQTYGATRTEVNVLCVGFFFLQNHRGNGRVSSAYDWSSELKGVDRHVCGYASPPSHHDPVFLVYSATLPETFNVLVA